MSNKRNNNKRARRERGNWRLNRKPIRSAYYLPIHPGLTEVTCPDCGAHWEAPDRQRKPGNGGSLQHADTCPIARGYADAADDDRAWFAMNPNATERVRPPTMAEIQALMLATGQALPDSPGGCQYEPSGEVIVRKASEQMRSRDFSRTVLIAQPILPPPSDADAGFDDDEYDANGVRIFREHINIHDLGN